MFIQTFALDGTRKDKAEVVGGILSDIIEEYKLNTNDSNYPCPKGLLDYKLEYGNLVKVQITKDKTAMMKLGKFLTKSGFSDKQARDASGKLRAYTAMAAGAKLQFTETGDEVIEVYENGPRSCMSNSKSVRVYVGDDVSVAYVKIDDRIVARAVVSKLTSQYSTIYGNKELLAQVLEKAGFESGDLEGCTIKAVYDGWSDEPVMPYSDGPDMADISSCREFVTYTSYGEYQCNTESGYLGEDRELCEECDDPMYEDERYYCELTERRLCDSCFGDSHVYVDGEYYHKESEDIVETDNSGYILRDEADFCHANNDWYPADEVVYSEEMQESYHESRVDYVIVNIEGEEDYILDSEVTTTEDEDGYNVKVWNHIFDEYNDHVKNLIKEENEYV